MATIDYLKEALFRLSMAISEVNEATDAIHDAWLQTEVGEEDIEDDIYTLTNESEELEEPINEVYDKVKEIIQELGGEIDD